MAVCTSKITLIRRGFGGILLIALVTLIALVNYNKEFMDKSRFVYVDWTNEPTTQGPNYSRTTSPRFVHLNISSRAPTDEISLVHLISYQRSGSSFAGGLFASNPEAFLIYEPLDMLYTAMFGISPGWTVPADIFYNKDGTLRDIPTEELAMMQWTLETILACNMSTFPVSMLVHPFWQQFQSFMPDVGDFVNCMRPNQEASKCIKHIASVCPPRFHEKARNLIKCRDVLWNSGAWSSNHTRIKSVAGAFAPKFQSYFACLNQFTEQARQCAKTNLDAMCARRTIRAVKTVRSPMAVAGRLLEKHPNSRVFHLLRDPRGATRSRTLSSWSWGRTEGNNIREHASRYCPNAVRDYKQLKDLSKTYPNRTMHVIYDGLVLSPMKTAEDMYTVVGKPVTKETKLWIVKNTSSSKKTITSKVNGKMVRKEVTTDNSSTVAVAWKSFYTYKQMQELKNECKEFFSIIDYPWI